jgi:hypothetical protein
MDALLNISALNLPDKISKKVLSCKPESLGMTFEVIFEFYRETHLILSIN